MASDNKAPSAYELGRQFFNDGRPIESNPYNLSAEKAFDFNRGWANAQTAHLRRTQPHMK